MGFELIPGWTPEEPAPIALCDNPGCGDPIMPATGWVVASLAPPDPARSDRSPVARVYLLTYLPILPDDQPPIGQRGKGCWPTVPITDGDAPWVVAKEKELNAMLATQASANKTTLVDAYKAGIDHDACKPPPLPTSQPNDNVRWVEPAAGFAAPLHPNAVGMRGTANAVEQKVQ